MADNHVSKKTEYLFPKKYCGYRWLANVFVISRIIEILPKLKKFVAEYKSPWDTKIFQTVKEAPGNPMFPMILEFSRSLAMELQPFMSIFQADRPLSVFLYEELKDVLHGLYQRIVKPKVLEANTTVVMMMS